MISNNVPLKKNNTTKSNENPHNTIVTVNPATEEIIKEYRLITKDEITTLANKSRKAFKEWKKDIEREQIFYMPLLMNLRRKRKD